MLGKLPTVFIALLLSAPWAIGQSTFGDILGVVKDPSQGIVLAAQVVLTRVEDKSEHSATTDADGAFHFVNLRPGHYDLLISAPDFAEFKISSAQLDARQTIRFDVALKLASAAQTIEVGGESGPVINTENATIGDSKSFQQITSLPVNYRGTTTSPLAMLATVPGAQQDANGNVSVGGGLPSQVQYSVDGSSTVNIRQNGALGNMNPSSELIGEFKVTQFNNNAEFAQLGDVTISTKSGTEQFHGSLFEYTQNSALDAAVWGSNINGTTLKPHKVFHTFGGSLGGPLQIPKLTHGKPKTFFFADYEGNRKRFSTPLFLFVPIAAMRTGDFSALLPTQILDPFKLDPITHQPTPYPLNRIPSGNQCTISQDCINPVAANLLNNYLPAPNIQNGAANFGVTANYLQQIATPSNTNGYDVRIDRTLTAKQALFVRWSWKRLNSQSLTDSFLNTVNNFLPTDTDLENNKNLIVSHNYAISDHLVNEARFGLSYYQLQVSFPIQGATTISTLGLQGLDISDHPTTSAFPTFNFSDDIGNYSPIGRDKAGTTKSQTIQFADNLTWIKGRHTMKFGADVRRVAYVDLESFGGSNDFGAFTFDQGIFTGNAFANLLLGLPTKTYIAQSGPDVHAHTIQTGVYAQDEWRFNDRLTLTFGLRWQALPPFVSDLANLTAFDVRNGGIIIPAGNQPRAGFLESINTCVAGSGIPCGTATQADAALGCVPVNAALPCAPVEQASSVGLGPGLRQFYKKDFQPRLGFAYRPFGNSKTVVRGGLGIFTMTNLGQLSFNTTNIDVAVVRTTLNPDINGNPTYQFPSVRTPDNPSLIAGTGDFYQNTLTDYRDPQSAQWNLTVERELFRDITLRESYVGMNSYRMSQTVDLNQVQPSTISPNPNPKPYPNWGRILSTNNAGHVNYQGLQSELNIRSRAGLTMQASHVWAKNLGNVGGDAPTSFNPEVIYGTPVANRFDLAANRGNVAQTRRHRLLVSAVYDVPAGRNRKFLGHMNQFSEAVLGGWSVSTVSLWETGSYLTPTTSSSYDPGNLNLSYRGAFQRPDCVGNGSIANDGTGSMFNINAFNPIPSEPIGNCGVGILEGPGTSTIAAGLAKTFHLTERMRLRFEGTFTNLLNHPNFAPPPTNVTASSFGQVQSVQTAENSGNRTGQLSLRLDF